MMEATPTSATQRREQKASATESRITRRQRRKLPPRQTRLLAAPVRRPLMRKEADNITGAPNSPEYVRALRALGLGIVCEPVEMIDRDGKRCRPGRYRLLASSRPYALQLLANSSTVGGE